MSSTSYPRLRFSVMLALGTLGGACTSGLDSSVPEAMSPGSRDEILGLYCEASLRLAGAFHVGAPQPEDVFGCWPVGEWRFTATVEENTCPTAPALEAEYRFDVLRDLDEVLHIRYLTRTDQRVKMRMSSGGGGLCEGGFELFGPDHTTVLRLKPALAADATIHGFGEYEVFATPQI